MRGIDQCQIVRFSDRIMPHLSGDEDICTAFDRDIHKLAGETTAADDHHGLNLTLSCPSDRDVELPRHKLRKF